MQVTACTVWVNVGHGCAHEKMQRRRNVSNRPTYLATPPDQAVVCRSLYYLGHFKNFELIDWLIDCPYIGQFIARSAKILLPFETNCKKQLEYNMPLFLKSVDAPPFKFCKKCFVNGLRFISSGNRSSFSATVP